jgi:hypothetical protein
MSRSSFAWSVLLLPALLCLQPAAGALPGSRLPFSLLLPQARLQLAMSEILGGEKLDGSVGGSLYDGAVGYTLGWHANAAQAAIGLRALKNGRVRATLTMPLQLKPKFKLRNGAEQIYAQQGCAAVWSSIAVSLDLWVSAGALSVARPVTGVTLPRNYACSFQRNLLGDIRNIVTRDTQKRVNVVPLMRNGVRQHLQAVAAPLQAAIAALFDGPALTVRLQQRLSHPLRVTESLYLDTAVDGLAISALSRRATGLQLEGSLQLRSRFRFGDSLAPVARAGASDAGYSDGFQLGFELLIPRAAGTGHAQPEVDLSRPSYRFVALPRHPGTAVLQRFQDERSEAVVWLRAGDKAPPHERRIPMEGAIEGVLAEIVGWLEANSGVRSAGETEVDRLRDEVGRFAALVAHFQRPRDLPLAEIGKLRLSSLRADLQWLSLEDDAVRAGVLLRGNAEVMLEL